MRIGTEAKRAVKKAPSIKQWGNGQHLMTSNNVIYSYDTAVAVWIEGTIYVPEYHSTTTSRHINIVAEDWNADVVQLWKL